MLLLLLLLHLRYRVLHCAMLVLLLGDPGVLQRLLSTRDQSVAANGAAPPQAAGDAPGAEAAASTTRCLLDLLLLLLLTWLRRVRLWPVQLRMLRLLLPDLVLQHVLQRRQLLWKRLAAA